MKKCNDCKELKPKESFYRSLTAHSTSRCKSCQNERVRAWRKKNPARVRELSRLSGQRHKIRRNAYNRRYYKANQSRLIADAREYHLNQKLTVFAAYGGSICSCCSETQLEFLCVDHVNNDGQAHRKIVKATQLYSWLIKNKFPVGFQVLCFNCNQGKRLNGGICPHKDKDVAF